MSLFLPTILVLLPLTSAFLYFLYKIAKPLVPLKGKTNIPGPTEGRRCLVAGDILWFLGLKTTADLWMTFNRLCGMRDKVMSLYVGWKLMIIVKDAEILEALMNTNKCAAKDDDFYHEFRIYSDGLLTRNGKRWSDLRRPLDKLMHPKRMDEFMSVFTDKAITLCDKVEEQCGNGVFDVNDLVQYCTLDITFEALMGMPGTQQSHNSMNIPYVLNRAIDGIFRRMVRFEYRIDWIFKWSAMGKMEQQLREEVRPAFLEILKNSCKNFRDNGFEPGDPDYEPQNMIDAFVQVGVKEQKTGDDLTFMFGDFIGAGYDTSSIAISSTILFLAMHPDYQERAYQEQLDVMKGRLEPPTREEINRMSYLEMAFNEALRHVTVPAVVRTLSAQFEFDGYIFPEGAAIYFSLHHIMKDPKHYAKPNDYYPDHFLPENVAKRPKAAFMPFSFGTRSCPGKIFSLLSAKLILSMLLRRFKFTTQLKYSEMTYKYMVMVESTKGYPVAAHRRHDD